MNGYDTVFANANSEAEEFEVLFDQEDSLIDTIAGCKENGDPLTGAEVCPAKTAEERSCDDCNPDYEKDIDADDTKGMPKDTEGTVGYDFEEEPEVGKKDDETYVDPDDVSVDEEVDFDFFSEAEDELSGSDTDSSKEADERSCDDCNPDYEKDIDADDTKGMPKDTEGTVGYDFEEEPEVGKKDDETYVDPDDVSVDEEVDFDFAVAAPEGSVKTIPDDVSDGTESVDDCGSAGCGSCREDVDYNLNTQSDRDGVDIDIEKADDPENYDSDDIVDFVDTDEKGSKNYDYDYSDEEIIDDVLDN